MLVEYDFENIGLRLDIPSCKLKMSLRLWSRNRNLIIDVIASPPEQG